MLKIAGKIGERMIEVDIALKDLKEAVEEDKLSSAEVPQDCCVDGEYQENIRFRTHVRKTLNTIISKLLVHKNRSMGTIPLQFKDFKCNHFIFNFLIISFHK